MAKLRFLAGPRPDSTGANPDPPLRPFESAPHSAEPTPRVDVVVDTPYFHRPFRPGRALWRLLVGAVDWALVVVLVGVVVWAVGELALRHYLPANGLTRGLAHAARWEGHVVMGFFVRAKG